MWRKKQGLQTEADGLRADLVNLLGIKGLTGLRLLNRYDVEHIDKELFENCKTTVFSEPQLDDLLTEIPQDGAKVFAVEFLPGQFDQRANSAAECIQIISKQDRPLVKSAKVYLLYGDLSDADVEAIKKYVINPVESREAALAEAVTLEMVYEIPTSVGNTGRFLRNGRSCTGTVCQQIRVWQWIWTTSKYVRLISRVNTEILPLQKSK